MIIGHILAFAVAMLVHELGHLAAASACRVPVRALGLGWGPKLFGFRRGGVDFKLHALPIGAYVRMDMVELQRRTLIQQVTVLLAGIVVNLVAAFAAQGTWFGMMNLLLAATNLLPLYQQDGWKCGMIMLRALLARRSAVVEWTFTIAGCVLSLAVFISQVIKYM
jgi:membrane-associated protease RseP (regulator of RpoE activity)